MSFTRTSGGAIVEQRDLGSLRGALSRFSNNFRDGNGRMPTEEELRECLEIVMREQVRANADEEAVIRSLRPLF